MEAVTIIGLVGLALLLLVAIGLLIAILMRKAHDASALQAPLGVLTQTLGGLQVELRGVSERVATVEREQATFGQGVASLGTKLAETDVLAKGISQTAADIRAGLDTAQKALAVIQGHAAARQQQEQQTAESIRRLEAIIAGTRSKGTAGENIMDLVFSQLPAEWQVRDFQVGSKSVEFGLRLPNNLILPIDGKWPATGLLEDFLAANDPKDQERIKSDIERVVIQRAKEVRKYIDPSVTVNFCIATVPDAVFDLCPKAQVESMRLNVVLLSYSMFVPYLLLTIETVLKTCQDIDLQKLATYLEAARQTVEALQSEMEGRLSKAITMLSNSRDEMRAMLSRIGAGLVALQLGAGGATSPAQLPKPEQAAET
jgi:DNA recombination protein RmuC